jgi:hypothetical protein
MCYFFRKSTCKIADGLGTSRENTLMDLYRTLNHETLLQLDKSYYNSLVYYKNVTIVSHCT